MLFAFGFSLLVTFNGANFYRPAPTVTLSFGAQTVNASIAPDCLPEAVSAADDDGEE